MKRTGYYIKYNLNMSIWNKDDSFLGRWLQNSLTPEEQKEFEASKEFEQFDRIIQVVDELQLPEYDKGMAFDKLMTQVKKSPGRKHFQLNTMHIGAVAAAVFLAVTLFYIFVGNQPGEERHITQNTEKEDIKLPDGSTVTLHSASKVSFNQKTWDQKRIVNLEGEAFFEVEKGKKFVVELPCGEVTVLGTTFNIKSRGNHCEVICYTGKVKVAFQGKEQILLPGEGIRMTNDVLADLQNLPENKEPGWTKGFSELIDVPFPEALDELRILYDLKISTDQDIPDDSIRVDIPHNNIETAIETVLGPLDLEYEYNQETNSLRILSD